MIDRGDDGEVRYDVIVPFRNDLHLLRPCIRTLDRFSPKDARFHLVDAGSDSYVSKRLQQWASRDLSQRFRVHAGGRAEAAGVANAIATSRAPWVIVLQADVLVTPAWLETLCSKDEHEKPQIVAPLVVEGRLSGFPGGFTFVELARRTRLVDDARIPIAVPPSRCWATPRRVLERHPYLDGSFVSHAAATADFGLRARHHGVGTVLAGTTMLFAPTRVSLDGHALREDANRLRARWGRLDDAEAETARASLSLSRSRIARVPKMPRGGWPAPIDDFLRSPVGWELTRLGRNALRRVRSRIPEVRLLQGRRPFDNRTSEEWRSIAQKQPSAKATAPPSVVYILPGIGAYGGVISVFQIVNRLILAGVPATVATHGRVDPAADVGPMLFQPLVFRSRAAMLDHLPRSDIAMSTSWDTAYDALLLKERWGCAVASFVQDYDPDTLPAGRARAAAELSLYVIDDKVVKSDWLAEKLAPFGGRVHKIPIGLDRDVFYPAPRPGERRLRVVSAARPGVVHRNLPGTLDIMRELCRRRADVTPTFFGKAFPTGDVPAEHLGRLEQVQVAELLRRSAVLLDASFFQGFGRPGLEAMGCGIPSVLTTNGGINEYARHGSNCLQADPNDVEANVSAIERVLDDKVLRRRMIDAGLETAARFDCELEEQRTYDLIMELAHGGA